MTFLSFALGLALIIWVVGKVMDGPATSVNVTTVSLQGVNATDGYFRSTITLRGLEHNLVFFTRHYPNDEDMLLLVRSAVQSFAAASDNSVRDNVLAIVVEHFPAETGGRQ